MPGHTQKVLMKKIIAMAVAAVASLFLVSAPAAQAQPSIPIMAPGVSLETGGGVANGGGWCTLGAIGTDDQGRLLGLTGGHCIPPTHGIGSSVEAANGVTIGHWVTVPTGFPGIYQNMPQDLSHDGAFFEFVPGIPVTNQMINGTRINAIQSSGPSLFQHFCKFGQVTGVSCGWVTGTGSPFVGTPPVLPGDSGGPAYTASAPHQATGAVLGLTSAILPTRFSDITNILADAAPQGVTGFTPIQY